MIPRRVLLENFLSIAGPVDFRFTDDEPLWVLAGPNGVGKSAVFDAITYCLYGEHRGGGQKAEQLIRHGANGFRVVFEFEFAGNEYRITRTRSIKGRNTQKVERRTGPGPDDWEAEPGVNSATDVKGWVKETLGLEFEAFTTSVMLRQGEADKLFSSSRDERIAVLKRIMKFEQFEKLSERVHAKTAELKGKVNDLGRQKEAVKEVTAEELAAAGAALEAAIEARNKASEAVQTAVERVGHSRQWGKLEEKRAELVRQLAKAEARAKQAEAIRADKARLADLAAAVPVLEALLKVRGRVAELEERLTTARGTLRVKELARDIKDGEKVLGEVAAVERLEEELKEYPHDLDLQLDATIAAESKSEQTSRDMSAARTRAETLLDQARDRQKEFADITVGATCSRCGQLVDAAHAEKEQARIAKEVKLREVNLNRAKADDNKAEKALTTVRNHRKALEKSKTDCQTLATELKTRRASLSALGEVTSAAELRARLAKQRLEKAAAEGQRDAETQLHETPAADVKQLDAERRKLDAEVNAAQMSVGKLETELAGAEGQKETILSQLSKPWQAQLPNMETATVAKLAADRNRLAAAGVVDKFKALEQDDTKRTEWAGQLDGIRADIADIPSDARIPEADAKQQQSVAQAAARKAETGRDAAVKTNNDLTQQKEMYERLTTDLRIAEWQFHLHKRLDDLLGQEGLQRELVRSAEEEIICLANDTLQNLSDGELSLEPDEDATGRDDKAFALRLRKAGDPYPIGVSFLSGSQKFRVAVSVALGVGRFASGQARPLEGVIIDEGFGGLDKDGLRAMAEELKRLQQSRLLKRIVLVSHQEEFTDQFPVGYRFIPGADGATAEPFRR